MVEYINLIAVVLLILTDYGGVSWWDSNCIVNLMLKGFMYVWHILWLIKKQVPEQCQID